MNHDSEKKYLERYAKELLESLFPDQYAQLSHSDSPDLRMGSDYGIEVTRAMFKNQGQANRVLDRISGKKKNEVDPRYLKTMDQIKSELITNAEERICGYYPEPGNKIQTKELFQAYYNKKIKSKKYHIATLDLFIYPPLAQLDGWLGEGIISEFFSEIRQDRNNPFHNIIVYEEPTVYLYTVSTERLQVKRGTSAIIRRCKKSADIYSGWSLERKQKQFEPEEEQLYEIDEPEEGEITEPFNPKDVDIVLETMVVTNLIDRLKDDREDGKIVLDPDFQRKANLWDDQKQSRLIESLIVRIPLPSFYFDYDDNHDNYIVVDGLQRLWAIRRFCALEKDSPEKLRLTGLEYLKEYEGKFFEELPTVIQRRIREQSLITYVIRPGTPEYVRNSIFTRINTGGIQLTPAEIKNSVYRGQAAELLKELAHSREFVIATNQRVDTSRMMDCELVNRFLAFYVQDINDYKDNLELYLNSVLLKLKRAKPDDLQVYRDAFFRAMELSHSIFGKTAFRKFLKGHNDRYGQLNKPLFECVSVCFARLSAEESKILLQRKESFLWRYIELIKSPKFEKAITNGTAKRNSIDIRYREMNRIIMETIE